MQYPKLKPQLLQSLIASHVPDKSAPLSDFSKFSIIISMIKSHGLLSEHYHGLPDEKLEKEWRVAINSWMDRVLLLAASNMPDKCWFGISLLGVTCQECSGSLFLASYLSWFEKLVMLLKPCAKSHYVKVASCATLSDLFTRLSNFPSCKKEGATLSNKLIPLLMQLLTENSSEDLLEAVTGVLCNLLTLFPSSFHRHYDNVEAVVMSILPQTTTSTLSQMLARLLALLPRSKGDPNSWCQMLTKVLISINTYLNHIFEGFEDANKGKDAVRLLTDPRKDTPALLDGYSDPNNAYEKAKSKPRRLLILHICTLVKCCTTLLTSPGHVQVVVPVHPLLSLVDRVLSIDGNTCYASMPVVAITQLEFIFSDLPVLHLSCLDLLQAIIEGVRSQLLPAAPKIVQLLHDYFRKFLLPSVRIRLYGITKTLLISMNVGVALYLANDLIANACEDLNSVIQGNASNYSKQGTEVSNANRRKKRKHASSGLEENPGVEAEMCNNSTPFCLPISALKALEALLNVGGSLHSNNWRPKVDLLLLRVATFACQEGWSYEANNNISTEDKTEFTRGDFQIASLQALLASLLSPCPYRPPHLSQGLALFRKGRQEAGMKLADFCAHAILSLEPLIHPRSLRLVPPSSVGTNTDDGSFTRWRRPTACENKERGSFLLEAKVDYIKTKLPDTSKTDNNPNGPVTVDDIYPDDKLCMGWLAELGDSDTEKAVKDVEAHRDSEEVRAVGATECKQNNLNIDDAADPCSIIQPEKVSTTPRCGTRFSDGAHGPAKVTVEELERVHVREGNSASDAVDESKVHDLVKPVVPPAKDDAMSTGNTENYLGRFSSLRHEEIAALSSDSESLPDIVVGDPDSDSDSE